MGTKHSLCSYAVVRYNRMNIFYGIQKRISKVHNNNAKCSTICSYCVSMYILSSVFVHRRLLALPYNITSHHNQDNYLADPEACHVH